MILSTCHLTRSLASRHADDFLSSVTIRRVRQGAREASTQRTVRARARRERMHLPVIMIERITVHRGGRMMIWRWGARLLEEWDSARAAATASGAS